MRISADARLGWAIVAMYGMPGVGKSALAAELWGRLSPVHSGSHAHVEWEAGVPFDRDRLVRRILIELGSTAESLEGASSELCLRLLGKTMHSAGNLVLVDGLSDSFSRAQVEAFLEVFQRENSTLLIVSRAKPTGFNADQLFEVKPLSNEASSLLLRDKLGASAESHPRELAEIVSRCGGLPRALEAVYAAVREGSTVTSLARDLGDPRTCLAALSRAGHDLSAELAFSYPGLADHHRRVLAAISLLRSESLCAWAVAMITGDGLMEVEGWLAELEDARLLTAEDAGTADGTQHPRYACHPLVRLALAQHDASARTEFGLSRSALDREYLGHANAVYTRWWNEEAITEEQIDFGEGRTMATMQWLRLEHQDVLHAVTEARRGGDHQACWTFAHMVAGFFPVISCDWELWREFFAEAEQAAGQDDSQYGFQHTLCTAAIVQAQGLLHLFTGRLDEAEPLLRDSLAAARRRESRDPDVQIRGYVHLAEVLIERGRYPRARSNVIEATNIPDPRSVDADQLWAGFVAAVVTRNLEPELWNQVLALDENRKRLLENADPTRHSRMSLYMGDALREIGDGAAAELEYDHARQTAERAGDHFTAARADYSLAHLLLDWGLTEQANSLIRLIRPMYTVDRDEFWLRRFTYLEARVAYTAGDLPRARTLLRRLYNNADPEKDSWLHANATLLLAEVYLESSLPTDAARVLHEAEAQFAETQHHWADAQMHYLLGRISHKARDLKAARAHLVRARDKFASCHDVRGEQRARRALASAWPALDVVRSRRHALMARRHERRASRTLTRPAGVIRPFLVTHSATVTEPQRPVRPASAAGAEPAPPPNRPARFDHDIFIYHDEKDATVGGEVAQRFRQHGVTCWVSGEEILVGRSHTQVFESGLASSQHIVVCVTSNLGRSGWAAASYGHFLHAALNGQSERLVIPLLIGEVDEADVPLVLRDRVPVSFSSLQFEELVKRIRTGGER